MNKSNLKPRKFRKITPKEIVHFEGDSFNLPSDIAQGPEVDSKTKKPVRDLGRELMEEITVPIDVDELQKGHKIVATDDQIKIVQSSTRSKRKSKENDGLMLTVIPHDYEVELVGQLGGMSLFAAERANHFHLVIDDRVENCIRQFHIPHYCLALTLAASMRVPRDIATRTLECLDTTPVRLATGKNGKIGFVYRAQGLFLEGPIGQKLSLAITNTVPVLQAAQKKVQERNGIFSLPKAKTVDGHLIESAVKGIIEAIAFEKVKLGKLTAKQFGIFSAFCTHLDFPSAIRNEATQRELINNHFDCYGQNGEDSTLNDLVIKVQDKIFPCRIWGAGIQKTRDEAAEAFAVAISKLNDYQCTQFALMKGMHAGNIFPVLAAIIGCISYDVYAELLSGGFQPNSKDEQWVRSTTPYIEMFGSLSGKEPHES